MEWLFFVWYALFGTTPSASACSANCYYSPPLWVVLCIGGVAAIGFFLFLADAWRNGADDPV